MNLGTRRLRGRPRNRWQDEVREDGRIVGGEGWQEKLHNREERKKLLRTARNRRILHMPMELNNLNTVSNTVTVSCESERLVAYVAHVGVRIFIHSWRQSESNPSWPINIIRLICLQRTLEQE